MNRLLVITFAAALSQFALGCATERTEIYEPAPTPTDEGAPAGERIDTTEIIAGQAGEHAPIPVLKAAPAPLDAKTAKIEEVNNHFINPYVRPTEVFGPVVDPAADYHMTVNGIAVPTNEIDPTVAVPQVSAGLSPLLVVNAPPTRGEAMTEIVK